MARAKARAHLDLRLVRAGAYCGVETRGIVLTPPPRGGLEEQLVEQLALAVAPPELCTKRMVSDTSAGRFRTTVTSRHDLAYSGHSQK